MATSSNSVRKTITSLSDPQQIRELNRQLDWVWHQLLGKLDAKAFSTKGISQILGYTKDVFTEEISTEDAGAAAFLNALATFAINKVAAHTFTAQEVIAMLADIMTLSKDNNGKVYISNFVASSDNISAATASMVQDIADADTKAQGAVDRLDNLSVTKSMLASDVWAEIQDMIDASIGGI